MQVITTITDVRQLVDTWIGSEYYTADPNDHPAAVEKIARQISDEAHEAGLNYGDDWQALLARADVNNCCAWLDGERSTITEYEIDEFAE
jgi:hypothetical protein